MARSVLRPSLGPDVSAPPNVSLLHTEARAGQGLFLCYRSGVLVARARSPRRAFEAVAAHLSSFDGSASARVAVPGLVFVRNSLAAVFPAPSRMIQDTLVPRLRQSGWALADVLTADLDPTTGDLVVGPTSVAIDQRALTGLPAHRGDGRPAPAGRYPVVAWLALSADQPQPSTLASRAVALSSMVESLDQVSAPMVLRVTAMALARAAWVSCDRVEAEVLVRALRSAVD
jgi:hypothetical protein